MQERVFPPGLLTLCVTASLLLLTCCRGSDDTTDYDITPTTEFNYSFEYDESTPTVNYDNYVVSGKERKVASPPNKASHGVAPGSSLLICLISLHLCVKL